LGQEKKKADVVEYPEVFDHVGLLRNEPPGMPGCPSSSHPTISIQVLIGADLKFSRAPPIDVIVRLGSGKASELFACDGLVKRSFPEGVPKQEFGNELTRGMAPAKPGFLNEKGRRIPLPLVG